MGIHRWGYIVIHGNTMGIHGDIWRYIVIQWAYIVIHGDRWGYIDGDT